MGRTTPVKAIRAKCLDCCCNQKLEVKLCPIIDCPLYPYRLGKRPLGVELVEENEISHKTTSIVPILDEET